METNEQESVTQATMNSVQVENLADENTKHSAADDYKRDMFKYKNEAKELRERLAEIELADKQRKGNLNEVISKLKEDLQAEKNKTLQMKSNFAEQRLDDAIKTLAMEKGIKGKQLEAFVKLIDNQDKSIVEFDERFNINQNDVTNLVDNHLKRYSEIFKRSVNVVDQAPNNNPVTPSKKFDLNQASSADIVNYIKNNADKIK